jgi:hypothetical protein
MNSFQRYTCKATLVGLCLAASNGAYAQISSINTAVITPRVFNDYPSATGTYLNAYPGSITLGESGEFNTGSSGFANKDLWAFSNDGSSAYTLGAGDTAFTISANLNLSPDTGTLDNEAGFVIPNANGTWNSYGGDLSFIAKASQDHFLGFFGGPGFWNSGISYVAGTSVQMTIVYYQTGATGNMQFSVTDGSSTATSPVESWTGNLVGNNLEAYFQLQGIDNSTGPGTSGQAVWSNISISSVPEPSTFALLSMSIVALGGVISRRRI